MSDASKPSLRIDWFDGTLIEETRSNTGRNASEFADEEQPATQTTAEVPQFQKKPIGYKKLLDISMLKPPALTLEISHKNSFWYLMDSELKGDFIVLIVKILANVYKSLEPGEKSMIITVLKSKFLKSNFLNTLKEYLSGLPAVRVVEKRINSQLWDDAESFYFNVLAICAGIYNFSGKNREYLSEAQSLLEVLEISALGVKEEHTERFRDELFIEIEDLKTKLLNSLKKESSEPTRSQANQSKDFNHFKNLNIFPTKADLLGNTALNIQPNIINGAYPSVEHYLDVQFKLLREDCFGPLREGISKYMENPNKRRHENIRVYPKVRIIRTYISNNKVGHLVDIAWTDRINHGLFDSKKYVYSKRLMFGSLLLFTSDNFETILCATVLDSGLNLLSDGCIAVSFHNPVSKTIFEQQFLMVESEVFFEPYHRVLKVMQESMDDLPMKKYIVDVQTQTQPPAYLTPETIYTIPDCKEDTYIPVLDTDQWPTPFDLDQSQLEAYKLALTREFAVIQGPPGTGKTFIGVKIASTILKNLSLEGTPMLIICYTNHALDQFLEGILKVTDNIVRLGSQSKNKTMEQYTLNSMRTKIKCKYSYLYSNKRKELEKIFNEMTEVQTEIEKCEKEIISYKSIKPYLKIDGKSLELKSSNEDSVLTWLLSHLDDKFEDVEEVEDWEKFDDLDISTDKLDTCFSEQMALKDMESMRSSMKYVKDVTEDPDEAKKMEEKFLDKIDRVRRRLDCFKKNMLRRNENRSLIPNVTDLHSLEPELRWQIYHMAVGNIKNELMAKMNALMDQHTTVSEELEEVATLIDGEVMSTARVVGVTTTAAARRHDLLKRLMSPIVIVEEAAEVLEAHIVASLTNRCQHLILIGDHKQLKPSAAHYKLAKHYNLEISLFERMIRNGIHARTLTTQRRMRPKFTSLIVPVIYERLDSHPSVFEYMDVRGMKENLWFYSHDVYEDSEGLEDSWSHRNTFEAKWCVALADYLRKMKYTPGEITILATYTGQATLIKELTKNYDSLRDVKVTVADNYQGEENRIVILSLVRSNRNGKIGFLSAENRICVALSRAKEGFYIFGNMTVLQSSSRLWKQINTRLIEQTAIGDKITLTCETHKTTVDVSNVHDMNRQGTCISLCKMKNT
ncbi:NFX1-type zinc finger-containing protein 1-like [Cydia fagiglandana]|uniref:NFX1-type zinc finger-containing protein 1-like n=1 Tax=Cydia fagiglandana TaxID=1458189 RepID=UPI002FEDEEF9